MRFEYALLLGCTVLTAGSSKKSALEGGPGGWEEIDCDEVKGIVWNAIPSLNVDNKGNWIVPFKILSASRQVVAGLLYKINVLTAETKCSRADTEFEDINTKNCPIKTDGRLEKWEIAYLEQEWMGIHNYSSIKIDNLTWSDVGKYKKR